MIRVWSPIYLLNVDRSCALWRFSKSSMNLSPEPSVLFMSRALRSPYISAGSTPHPSSPSNIQTWPSLFSLHSTHNTAGHACILYCQFKINYSTTFAPARSQQAENDVVEDKIFRNNTSPIIAWCWRFKIQVGIDSRLSLPIKQLQTRPRGGNLSYWRWMTVKWASPRTEACSDQ